MGQTKLFRNDLSTPSLLHRSLWRKGADYSDCVLERTQCAAAERRSSLLARLQSMRAVESVKMLQ